MNDMLNMRQYLAIGNYIIEFIIMETTKQLLSPCKKFVNLLCLLCNKCVNCVV